MSFLGINMSCPGEEKAFSQPRLNLQNLAGFLMEVYFIILLMPIYFYFLCAFRKKVYFPEFDYTKPPFHYNCLKLLKMQN